MAVFTATVENPMHIRFYLADQNPHRDRTLGITNYTEGLLGALVGTPGVQITWLASASSYTPSRVDSGSGTLPFKTDHAVGRLLADQLHPLLPARKTDLWHYPKGYLPLLLRSSTPCVGTIHDTILQHYADHYPRTRSTATFAYWLAALRRSVSRFDLLLTVSQFSKNSILAFCERHKIKAPPIKVTYEGCQFEKLPQPVNPLKQDIVVHLASPLPHKKTLRVLELWRETGIGSSSGLKLLLIGSLGEAEIRLAKEMPLVEHRHRLGIDELELLIRAAKAVVVSSEVEGFGLPALEAYMLGTPAVYVRGTSLEEILGQNHPGGFHLAEPETFARAMEEVINLAPQQIHDKGMMLRSTYSWAACAARTVEAYRSCLQQGR